MEYIYPREKVNGVYNINNVDRVDPQTGEHIRLAIEIELALPGKHFYVRCADTGCAVIFDGSITTQEKATLDTVVANHKNNT